MSKVLIEGGNGIRVLMDRLDPPKAAVVAASAFSTEKEGIEMVPEDGLQVLRQLKAYSDGQIFCDAILAHMFSQVLAAMEEEGEAVELPEPSAREKAEAQGYVIEEGGGGWATVTGPAMPEPRKAQGQENLDKLLEELMARDLEDDESKETEDDTGQ